MPDFLAGLCDPDTLQMLAEGTLDTLYMTLASTFFAYVFGMIMAVVLVVCRADGIRPCPGLYKVLDVVVNLTRSFPFLILMIAVIPLTRFLVGTTIGNNAPWFRWSSRAGAFVGRLMEILAAGSGSRHCGSGAVHGSIHLPDHLQGSHPRSIALPD